MEKLISSHGRRIQEFLYPKAGLSVGKRTGENQLNEFQSRGVCVCYAEQPSFSAHRRPSAGPRENGNMIAFFSSRGDGIIHSLSLQELSEAA